MKRFWLGANGSVSVYFIVILVPVFLFMAVFVDLIRIKAAERESEMALKTGLRSVMSGFETSLREYGLFGLQWEQQKQQDALLAVVDHNLTSDGLSGFRYTDTRSDRNATELSPIYTLANPAVFKRQVSQEMKIKAPVEFLTELVDKFKKTGASAALNEASDYYEQAEKLERLHWEREEALDRAWAAAQDFIAVSQASARSAEADLTGLQALGGRIGLHSIDGVRSSIQETEQGISRLMEAAQSIHNAIQSNRSTLSGLQKAVQKNSREIDKLRQEISNLETSLSGLQSSKEELEGKKVELEQLLNDMSEYTARFISTRLSAEARDAKVHSVYRKLELALDEAEKLDVEWRDEADRLRKDRSIGAKLPTEIFQTGTVYTASYFTSYRTGAGKIAAVFNGLSIRWKDVEWWHSAQWDVMRSDAALLQQQIGSFEAERKADEAGRGQRNEGMRQEEDKHRGTVRSSMGEVKQALGSCGIGEDPYKSLYRELQNPDGLAAKYRAYHRLSTPDNIGAVPDDADLAITQSIGLWKNLSGLWTGFRDEWMLNEYLLDKFNYRTSGFQTAPIPARESHPLQNQEVEYAMYGFGSCGANYGAAYGELYILLLGIRTVEALLEPQTQAMQAGSPLLAVLAAAAKGSVLALSDVRTLTDGGSVRLFQKLGAFQVDYKDFLRLFLMLHPNQSSVMVRLQALLELNTGVDLTRAATYIQGTGTTSVNLWFMPGIYQWLNRSTGLGCEVEKGKCQIQKTAVYAYD